MMMTQTEIETRLRDLKPILSNKFYVDRIGYFGSYARNDQDEKSDIDILVEFRKPLGWDFFDLHDLLEKELDLKVDLVSIKALRNELRDSILQQTRYV
ncbi:MAG: nucleotidyltransferase family protein [Bacteroidales bacterium]|nr:nucleotidyltransferase family protein [Bacteroidales bacterium]MCF8455302.1 nucleotidyltransferase family protein [Bacteroidales bacterium]